MWQNWNSAEDTIWTPHRKGTKREFLNAVVDRISVSIDFVCGGIVGGWKCALMMYSSEFLFLCWLFWLAKMPYAPKDGLAIRIKYSKSVAKHHNKRFDKHSKSLWKNGTAIILLYINILWPSHSLAILTKLISNMIKPINQANDIFVSLW